MTRHVTWKEVADEMIHGGWGTDREDAKDYIRKAGGNTDYLAICLLRDIAESLRVLRCSNFQDIPNRLTRIARNTHKRRKKSAK